MGCPLRSLESSRVSEVLPSPLPAHVPSLTVTRLSKPRRRTLHRQRPPARTAARHQFHYVILALQVSVSLPRRRVTSRHPRIVPRKVIPRCARRANPRHRVTSLAPANLFLDNNVKVVLGHLRPSRLSRLLEGSNSRFSWTLFIRYLLGEPLSLTLTFPSFLLYGLCSVV